MTADELNNQIRDLKRQLTDLQSQVDANKPTVIDREAEAKWRDEMRAISERRASADALSHYSPAQVRAMREAADPGIWRDHCGAPTGPSAGPIPTSQQLSNVHTGGGPINRTGWRQETPLGPQPGIDHIDRLLDEQDRRDRTELEQKLAKR